MKYFFLQLLILLALFGSHVHGQDIMRVHNNNNLIFQHRVDKIDPFIPIQVTFQYRYQALIVSHLQIILKVVKYILFTMIRKLQL